MDSIDKAFDKITDEIKGAIGASSDDWHPVNCPMCKNRDQQQKKGGFKFEVDQILYNCFRGSCEATTVYTKGEFVPWKFRDLLDTYGIQVPIELMRTKSRKKALFEEVDDKYEKNTYSTLTLPKTFTDDIPDHWVERLFNRNVIYDDFLYAPEGNFKGCLVVPHYFHDKLIGWDYWTDKGMYITAPESNENMLYIPGKVIPKKVLVVEGLLDATCFPNTIATKKAKIDPKQAYHLRNSDVIVLPDRTGSKLYESAKYYGWKVALPMWKEKDLEESVRNRGILITAQMIREGTMAVGAKSDVKYRRWTGTIK